jgi:mono/diheme cytochrome c family protein
LAPFGIGCVSRQRCDEWANIADVPGNLTRFGWAQLPGRETDAWATGTALYALHVAGGLPTSDPAFQRGVEFLLRTQFDDGSWWVRSRSWPFQPHFDSQFPHGKDQWISAAGTAFATMALLITIEPSVEPKSLPDARALIAKFLAAETEKVTARTEAPPGNAPVAATVTFARDITPLIERSCAGCHVGAKVKGGLSLASRESLLKGGQSGDPAIVAGRSSDSHLLRYISDQVEDLEMPPLSRRVKYPPFSAAEIALVRTWIDCGAK